MEPLPQNTDDTYDGDAARPATGKPAGVESSPRRRAAIEVPPQDIPVDEIFVVGTRRALNEEKVPDFVESIKRSDLLQPIIVRIQKNLPHPETAQVLPSAYVLVAGLHRLEAHRRLGRAKIRAIVLECSALEAERMELEENLIRAELTPEEKIEQTIRLAAVIKAVEEGRKDSDFSKQGGGGPTTGRGHKGTIQKTAERIGVDQGTVRHRVRNAQATIGEPIDLARDSSAELRRKADKFRARTSDPKAKRKTYRKEREKTQAAKPARKDRERRRPRRPPGSIEYDCNTATGRVFVARGRCADMTSTILLFERIAPDVCVIETFADERRHSSYHRTAPTQWRMVGPDGRSWPPVRVP